MDKPYIKKYGDFRGFSVWIVDGEYIRNNIDEEFTNFAQHTRFRFIPKDEFWIDEENGEEDEGVYFIENMFVQNKLMSKGMSYEEAVDRADIAEKKERAKKEFILKNIKKFNSGEILEKVHKKLITNYGGEIKVWIIDGRIVRDLFYVDFTEGGHDKVYSFVPKNEVWIDDDLNSNELKFVLLHEIHERTLMSGGMDYNTAHKHSSKLEHFYRKNPKNIDLRLKKEFKLSPIE